MCTTPSFVSFSTTYHAIPGTGSVDVPLVEVKCLGTVSNNGARCDSLTGTGESVMLRIDGVEYSLYRGCAKNSLEECLTNIVTSSSSFRYAGSRAGAELLCEAMGYTFANPSNPGDISNNSATVGSRPAAIVQLSPYATVNGVKGASTPYVNCAP